METRTQLRCSDPECKRIRERLREEIRKLKSVSYDIIKQKGDWQCGGKTHEEHGEVYDDFFLRQVEEMTSHLETVAKLERAQAKHLLCQLFQTIHERCKDRVLDRMKSSLLDVTRFSGSGERTAEEEENLHDACRAYGLLLHSSQVRKIPEHSEISSQVHSDLMRVQESLSAAETELKKFSSAVAELSWDLLTTVPPLVVSQPTRFSRRQHKTENWDDDRKDEQLTYFRPVLYSSYKGRVNQKGWVTNRATGYPDILLNLGNGAVPKADDSIKPKEKQRSSRRRRKEDDKYADFVYIENDAVMQSVFQNLLGERGGGGGGGEREGEQGRGEREEEAMTAGIDSALPFLKLR